MDTLNLNTLTIVTLAYWTIAALWAGFRGMIRTVLSFFVIILTIIITYTATPAVFRSLHRSAYINNFLERQASTVIDNLADGIAEGTDGTGLLELLPLPEEAQAIIEMGNNDMIAQVIRSDSVKGYLSIQFANVVLRIVATVVTALAVFILLTILRIILLVMSDLPVISTADHFLGFIIGLIKGIVVIWIALLIIRLVALTGHGVGLMRQVRESEVLTLLDEYNMIRRLISSLITGL